MKRAPTAVLLAAGVVAAVSPPRAANPEAGPRPAAVVLIVMSGYTFEDVMAVRAFRQLATGGGAALMTTATPVDSSHAAYATLGAGAQRSDGFLLPDLLESAGVVSCFAVPEAEGGVEPIRRLAAGRSWDRDCTDPILAGPHLIIADFGDLEDPAQRSALGGSGTPVSPARALALVGEITQTLVSLSGGTETMVVVAEPAPSAAMRRVGDEVTPIVVATGAPASLFPAQPAPRALTSDTTRAAGLVANVDVAPTILDFLGLPIPAVMDGQPIQTTDAAAPFELHRRHLEQRRIRLPIQLAHLAAVVAPGMILIPSLFVLRRKGRLPRQVRSSLRICILAAAAIPIPLMAGGLLPSLAPGVVVPFVVVSVGVLTAAAVGVRRAGPVAPFVFLGAVGFSFAVLDLAFGTGLRIPLLGGTMFDGVRFYGLPNAFIGLVLAGAVFLAVALSPGQGFALLMAAGVVVGYPSLGADIGGAVTLFAAAAVWWALVVRRGSRSRPRDAAIAVGIVVAGTLGVLLANRYLAVTPTHATRFVEGGGLSPADVVRREVDRLAVGFRMIRRIPAGWIPVLGTPVLLGFAIMRPTPFGQGFEAVDRNWREAMIALTTAGAASVLANDTFVAAVGLTFLYALAGMAYPALLAPGGDRRPIRPAVGRRREMERRR